MLRFEVEEVRRKYSKTLPDVVAFFKKAQEILAGENKKKGTNGKLFNSRGLVSLKVEIGAWQSGSNGRALRRNLKTIQDASKRLAKWLNR
jgi:hypothetical protein